ncbi:MAG: hypothetical protein M0Z66_14530 [Thermaerobacter sp.]|nr:hypothetical protein [Thermaerobacter sp.]
MEWQWIAARASGFTAYGLVTLATVFGLLLSQRWQSRRVWPRLINDQMHQHVVLLAGVFTAIHGIAVWVDPFTKFTWLEVVLPGISHYRPLWMALGIVAAYLGMAVVITGWLRPKIGYAWWRRLHYLTFIVWLLATLHGLGDGSDSRTAWAIGIYGISSAAVVGLTLARLLRPAGSRARSMPGWAGLTSVIALGGLVFALLGPLRPGWNAIANGGKGSGSRLATAVLATNVQAAYSAPFQGSVTQQGPDAQGVVTLSFDLLVQGGPYGVMTLTLQGTALPSGGVALTGSSLALGTPAEPGLYEGGLAQLNGGRFSATLRGNGLSPITVVGNLSVDSSNNVQGIVQVQPGVTQEGTGSGPDGGGF